MTRRRAELAAIHVAKAQLGLDDDTYRELLNTIAGVTSARDLDDAGRRRVLDHLRTRGFTAGAKGRPRNVGAGLKGPLMRKIEALLADAKRPWAYVDAIALRSFGVERVTFCDDDQLRKLVAMLTYDQRRRGRQ